MIQMLGENRVFDSITLEAPDSTSTNRVINLYGVQDLDELVDKPLLVKSSSDGEDGAVTMTIATSIPNPNYDPEDEESEKEPTISQEIGSADLYVFDNRTITDPFENWVKTGQPYCLIYDGTDFNAYPIANNKEGGGSSGASILTLPHEVLELTSSSTQANITSAFGGEDEELTFQSWVEGVVGPIKISKLEMTTTTPVKLIFAESKAVSNYSYDGSGTKATYTLAVLTTNVNNGNIEITSKVLVFEKDFETAQQENPNLFDTVTVYESTITNGNGVAY